MHAAHRGFLLDVQPGYAPGRLLTFEDVEQAVKTAWLIIECVPEKLPLKIELLGELDRLADADAIIASNSSSFRSSEMVTKVSNKARGEKCRLVELRLYHDGSRLFSSQSLTFTLSRLPKSGWSILRNREHITYTDGLYATWIACPARS